MKRVIQGMIGIGMSALMLWLAFRNVDVEQALRAMVRVEWWVYPVYVVLLYFTYVLRTFRWQLQMDRLNGKHMPFWDAFAICSVSFAGTFLLPFRLGEFIRPYLAAQKGYGRQSTALATVALERVLDGLVMTGFLAVTLTQLKKHNVPAIISMGGYVALAVFGGAMVVFVAAYRWKEWSIRFWKRLLMPISPRMASKALGMLNAFIEGLKSLPTVGDVVVYMSLTVGYWVVNGLSMYTLAEGMNLGVPVVGGFFTLACLVVGITIPAGPGNVGNFEYAIQIALKVFGVTDSDGAAYAIWTHLVQTIHMVLTAALCVLVGKIVLRAPPPPED